MNVYDLLDPSYTINGNTGRISHGILLPPQQSRTTHHIELGSAPQQ